jgi:CII-binding regulator of phage lambda lysogenization HflD
MKFVHHLFINTIVALNLIIAYEFFIVEPRISQLGSIVRVEAKNRIDADKKMEELKTKMDELETVLTEHKKRANERTENFAVRFSKLENRLTSNPQGITDIEALKKVFFQLDHKIKKIENLLPKLQRKPLVDTIPG